MPLFNKKSIRLPDTKAMAAALADVRAIQAKHDSRLMLMIFLDRAALTARNLKALGMETDGSIDSLFAAALVQAKEKPRKAPTVFDPNAKPEGKLS